MRPMGRCQRAQLRSSTLARAVQRSLHEFVIGEMIKNAEGVSVARTPHPTAQRVMPRPGVESQGVLHLRSIAGALTPPRGSCPLAVSQVVGGGGAACQRRCEAVGSVHRTQGH